MKELHEKSLKVLDVIEQAREQIANYPSILSIADYWGFDKDALTKDNEATKAALNRLICYHRSLLYKLLHSTK